MATTRLIARLDVKAPNLVKGIHLEGLRVMGDPQTFARRYFAEGIDEILYVDIVASLYGRNNILDVVRRAAEDVFIPLTVAGGLRSVGDVRDALRSGADKVAINTAAVADPELIRRVAEAFGSQCVVVEIQTKKIGPDRWEAYTDNGRERSGLDALEWAQRAVELGAGETSGDVGRSRRHPQGLRARVPPARDRLRKHPGDRLRRRRRCRRRPARDR